MFYGEIGYLGGLLSGTDMFLLYLYFSTCVLPIILYYYLHVSQRRFTNDCHARFGLPKGLVARLLGRTHKPSVPLSYEV